MEKLENIETYTQFSIYQEKIITSNINKIFKEIMYCKKLT